MRSLVPLHRHLWFSSRKLAEKYIAHARHLLSSQEPADIHSAISLLDAALKLSPQWDKALELKARALLCLRRFRDVANLLHDSIPSFKEQSLALENPTEKLKLLSDRPSDVGLDGVRAKIKGFYPCFPVFKLRRKLSGAVVAKRPDREQWKWLVLGQACCHLGMMEDAMVLLSKGKHAASSAFRKRSNRLHDDGFGADAYLGADYDVVSHLLGNIKFLLRRRMVAIAAFEVGRYAESVKHLSKLLDGRRGTPQGFIAECYLLRAKAYQADGRITDAIADCNRTLTLNPMCAEGLSIRATLFEMVGCLSECAGDLSQVKALYAALLESNESLEQCWVPSQTTGDTDLQGCFNFVSNKLAAIKEKLALDGGGTIDYHTILGVSRGCARADVERAYLLLSLRHRPDKSASFVDRCEFVDERDMDYVKDEARNSAFRLFQLIQRAYTGIMSVIVGEEMHREESNQALGGRKSDAGNKSPLLMRLEKKLPDILASCNALSDTDQEAQSVFALALTVVQ